MSVKEDIICRLCLKIPHTGFVLIDKATRQGLDILSLKLNFDVSNDLLMCEDCMEVSKRSLSFILACLKSEKQILLSDMGEDDSNIDLRDVYAIESKPIVNEDSYICRFCLNKIEERNFVMLDGLMKENMPLNMLKQYIFQMDENVIKNPIVCFHCRDNMENYIKFLRTCHDTEEKINMYMQNEGTPNGEKIKLSNIFQFSKSSLEYPNKHTQIHEVKREPSVEEGTEYEFIDIYKPIDDVKEEYPTENKEINNFSLHQNDPATDHISSTSDTKDSSCNGCLVGLNESLPITKDIKVEAESWATYGTLKSGSEDVKDTLNERICSKCNTEFEIISTGPTMYKCQCHCYVKTKLSQLENHAEETMTQCDGTMDKCPSCDYKSSHKNNFKYHLLTHKTKTDVTMHKCTICDFQTMYKNNLKRHSLTHKTQAELTMYKCTACDYQTRYKGGLEIHSLSHKAETEVTMYRCPTCKFKTKHKSALKSHSVKHMPKEEVTMYRCTDCNFMTIHKNYLKRHLVVHKTEAELMMFECVACDFKTKYKRCLTRHFLTH